MKWFRFYEDALNNPKAQSLPGDLFKFWVNVLCVTSQCDGTLPSHCDIAFYLRISETTVTENMAILVDKKLLEDVDGLRPRNWDKRQYKSDTSAERTRKYRENKKQKCDGNGDVTETVTVTPPDTDTDTDTDNKKIIIKDPAQKIKKEEFEKNVQHAFGVFWDLWPARRRVKKPYALKTFTQIIIRDGPEVAQKIIDGVVRQTPGFEKTETKFLPHPSSWLNKAQWLDAVIEHEHRSEDQW